jgi:hypothetical protein
LLLAIPNATRNTSWIQNGTPGLIEIFLGLSPWNSSRLMTIFGFIGLVKHWMALGALLKRIPGKRGK